MNASDVSRAPIPVHLRIGAERVATGTGGTHDRVNPSTGQVDGTIPLAGPEDVDRAVKVAHEAFLEWRRTPGAERRRLLLRLADLMDENATELSRLTALDNGTKYSPGGKAGMASAYTRYYAGWADKYTSDVISSWLPSKEFSFTLAQPYGVIGVIVTWNGPVASIGMKVPAALAAGNTVVIKPSELTPYGPELLCDLVEQAGFPPGVFNVLTGTAAAGEALVRHPLVRKVTFTGGPATATKVLQACADTMKPAVLELGGKSANIIFDDAELGAALSHGTLLSCGFLAGQICAAPSWMLVQDTIYDDVVDRVATTAKAFSVGDPFDPATVAGPVINEAAIDRILAMVERAQAQGARLVTGGARVQLPGDLAGGYFVEPTVLADVDPQSEVAQNEVFGPVLAITPFTDEADALEKANSTRYGLAGYVHTQNISRALRVAEQFETGDVMINGAGAGVVNRPFGGLKISGMGKEGGRQGLEEFLQIKGVGIGMGDAFSFGG